MAEVYRGESVAERLLHERHEDTAAEMVEGNQSRPQGYSFGMSNVGRGAIVFVTALVIGTYTYASASDLDRNGALGTIVFSTPVDLAFFVLPVLVIALVNRWWALLLAFVPFGVHFYLHEATDYAYPFHEDPYPALVIFGTGFLLAIYALGFLLRAAFDQAVSERWARRRGDKLS